MFDLKKIMPLLAIDNCCTLCSTNPLRIINTNYAVPTTNIILADSIEIQVIRSKNDHMLVVFWHMDFSWCLIDVVAEISKVSKSGALKINGGCLPQGQAEQESSLACWQETPVQCLP